MGRVDQIEEMWPDRFPIFRTLIAFALVPPLTLGAFSLLGWLSSGPLPDAPGEHTPAQYLLLAPVVWVIYSWPGYVTFAALGLPTLYFLYRLNRAGFPLFALIGLVYTSAAWVALMLAAHAHDGARAENLRATPLWAIIGAIGGMITRVIVLGWRDHREGVFDR